MFLFPSFVSSVPTPSIFLGQVALSCLFFFFLLLLLPSFFPLLLQRRPFPGDPRTLRGGRPTRQKTFTQRTRLGIEAIQALRKIKSEFFFLSLSSPKTSIIER